MSQYPTENVSSQGMPGGMQENVQELRDKIAGAASKTSEKISEMTSTARQRMSEATADAKERLSDMGDRVRSDFNVYRDNAISYTRSNPGSALLIAASVGFGLGLLMRFGRS